MKVIEINVPPLRERRGMIPLGAVVPPAEAPRHAAATRSSRTRERNVRERRRVQRPST